MPVSVASGSTWLTGGALRLTAQVSELPHQLLHMSCKRNLARMVPQVNRTQHTAPPLTRVGTATGT